MVQCGTLLINFPTFRVVLRHHLQRFRAGLLGSATQAPVLVFRLLYVEVDFRHWRRHIALTNVLNTFEPNAVTGSAHFTKASQVSLTTLMAGQRYTTHQSPGSG